MKLLKKDQLNKLLVFILIIWIILAIIFGFTDLSISIALSDPNSLVGIIGKYFGESPGYGLAAVSLTTLIGSYIPDLEKQKYSAFVGLILSLIFLFFGVFLKSIKIIIDGMAISVSILLFLIFNYQKDWRDYRKISQIILILLVVNPLLFVQTFKTLWGRTRFYNLSVSYSDYSPWFIPQGITGEKSFPSGHAAMGSMFFPLLIKLKNRRWSDPKKILGVSLILGWAIFVGVSRILIGAHYASDVLFSIGMTSIITIVLYKRVYKNSP